MTLLSKKQSHHDLARWLDYSACDRLKVRLKKAATLYKKASNTSEVIAHVPENTIYNAHSVVPGMDASGHYTNIFLIQDMEPKFLNGYVDFDACEFLNPEEADYS